MNATSMNNAADLAALLDRLESTLAEPLAALDLSTLSKHNASYAARYGKERFNKFVVAEWPYYSKVIQWYLSNVPVGSRVLEIGMFVPVVPLALSWLGYQVTAVEKFQLYGDSLNPLVQVAKENGVSVIDCDIMEDELPEHGFQVINLLCVVEHLLGSPKVLLDKLRDMMSRDSVLFFVVPNQARLVRRVGLFFGGMSVQPDFQDYFNSEYPFSGHNREYTRYEMHYALTRSGFDIQETGSVKYPASGPFIQRLIGTVGNLLPGSFHQLIYATAKPAATLDSASHRRGTGVQG